MRRPLALAAAFLALLNLLAVPAAAQSTRVIDPSTGQPVFSSANPAPVTIVSGTGVASTVSQPTASNLNAQVVGTIADNGIDSGNPIKVGGRYNSTLPTYADGDRGDLQIYSRGQLVTIPTGWNAIPIYVYDVGAAGDGESPFQSFGTISHGRILNGSGTYDRQRSIVTGTNSTGTGITAVGLVAQGDDASIQAITENSFGNLRLSLTNHALVVQPYETSANSWQYASGTTGILSNTTTAVTIKAAAGAGLRNYIKTCQITTTAFGAAVPLAIRDGAGGTVIWSNQVATSGWLTPQNIIFEPPVRGTANTLLEVVTTTANTSGTAMVNCQGFVAP